MRNKLFTATALLFASQLQALDIRVNVSGLQSDKGALVVQVYDSKDTWLSEDTVLTQRQDLNAGDSEQPAVIIPIELAPGNYALSVYHDENSNDALDANFIGIPKEPVGLSNDHRPRFGPPRYSKAEITISAEGDIKIRLD